MFKSKYKYLTFLSLFMVLLVFLSRNLGFFWDNVLLSSKMSHFFYEHGWNGFILDNSVDCGHPPFFAVYLAAAWKLMGKTLWASHLAMLPILGILVYHYYRIIAYFLPATLMWLGVLVFVTEPTLIAQCTMVSNEVVQFTCFIWALSLMLRRKYLWLILPTIIMTAVSMRAVMVVFGLFLAQFVLTKIRERKWAWSSVLYYIPSALFFVAWNYYHYLETGWFFTNLGSRWSESYGSSDMMGFIKNFLIVGWHFLDFGRIAPWLLLLIPGISILKSMKIEKRHWEFLGIFLFSLLPVFAFLLSRDLPIGHRYFTSWYLLATLGVAMILGEWKNIKWRNIAIGAMTFFLLTGNLWTYPDKIAQGWDSTLGHLPYFSLRTDMIEFMEENKIPFDEVAAGYTMHASSKIIMLENTEEPFLQRQSQAKEANYFWYSNIVNSFTDEELDDFENNWELLKEMQCVGVKHRLYKRSNSK